MTVKTQGRQPSRKIRLYMIANIVLVVVLGFAWLWVQVRV